MPLTDPIQGWQTPAGTELPDGAAAFAALRDIVVKQAVMVFATTAARDTAIPAADTKKGMLAFITSLGYWQGVFADAGPWKAVAGAPSYLADQNNVFTFTATYTDVPGVSVTLPAGQWLIQGVGNIDVSSATERIYFVQMNAGAYGTYFQKIIGDTVCAIPFALRLRMTNTASQAVKIEGYTSVVDGSQYIQNCTIFATPVVY